MTNLYTATSRQELTGAFSIRPYVGDDENSVVALWNKCLLRDPITTETFRRKVLLDENFDQDGCIIVSIDEMVVGFCLAVRRRYPYFGLDMERGRGWITAFFVHPSYRTKGFGKKLVTAGEHFLKSCGVQDVFVSSYTPNYFAPGIDLDAYEDALTFLKNLGYKRSERVYSMGRSLMDFQLSREAENKLAALASQGIKISVFDPKFLTGLIEFLRNDYPGELLRVALEKLRRNPNTDEIILAVKDEHVIGFSHFEEEHFGPFAIEKEFMGRGIGTSLYYATAVQMKEKGQRNLWLAWTTGHAKDFYHRCGLRVTRRHEIMKKSLR
ncbi:MAG TPA: GNAT family N-acetyltransferase [Candidatus Kryptonia bacterium]